jgi:Putative peptidoglycan binding domain/Glycosyl hydrolase family 46
MGRIFFQRASADFRAVRGELIRRIRQALQGGGFYNGLLDGIYGNQTELALQKFQQHNQLPVQTGKVDEETWQSLTSTNAPDLRQRCLQMIADFEGTGFTKIVGNFDGAGLTWGIIGFTLSNGELGDLLNEINSAHPDIFRSAFGDLADQLLHVLQQSRAKQMNFANSISIGSSKVKVLDKWAEAFARLGSDPAVQEIQIQHTTSFFEIALRDVARFNVKNELGLALCFDIAVQNGGIDQTEATRIRTKIEHTPPTTQQDLRIIIANVIAENSKPKFIEDVRRRKLTIATGRGTVHGSRYDLKTWGLDDLPAD